MIYCDTSLIVAVITPERFSAEARAWLDLHPLDTLARSGWTDVEIASAIARKQRSRALDVAGRMDAEHRWRMLREGMLSGDDAPGVFAAAATLVDAGPRGLRAGDALHLAIARHAGLSLATLDRDLADAAEAVGVAVALRPPA